MKKRFLIPVALLIPCISLAEKATIDVKFTTHTNFTEFLETLGSWLYTFALAAVPIVILIGAFMFVTAAGNPERVKTGRRLIIWAIVGLAIVMTSKGIIILVHELLS